MRNRSRFNQIVRAYLWRMRRKLALGFLCIMGSTVVAVVAPWPLKLILDYVLLGQPLREYPQFIGPLLHASPLALLAGIASSQVVIALLAGFFGYYELFFSSDIGYRFVYRLRGELFDHLQRLSLSFHNRARTGELLKNLTGDTNVLRDVFAEYALNFVASSLTIASMFVVMFLLNWKLALVVLASFPVLFLILLYVLRKVRKSARRQRAKEGDLAARLGEVLKALPLVQAFGRQSYERRRFESVSEKSLEQSIRTARTEATAGRWMELISAIGTSIVVLFGGLEVLAGRMTPGDLLVFVAYISRAYKPARTMARLSVRFSTAAASAESIGRILAIDPGIQDAPDAIDAAELRSNIVFDNVSFAYDDGKPVLRNVSFAIPAGKRVALVGASGAGKSTIANLMLRLYDPVEGRVLIDGVDIRRLRRDSLLREIGVVLQDSILFGTTIRENIAYGKLDATIEEIEQAARTVHAHDFIARLSAGYDEVIGEGGATLSGGERQRICLARALIRQPSILIMDEPTAAVDADSEALIRHAVQRLQDGKTTLLIAHQAQSVRDADHILVLKDGSIVEQGTHEELASLNGHYRELFRLGEAPSKASAQGLAVAN